MRWPGQRALEQRIEELEQRNYSDAITAALLQTAEGDTTIKATATATAALEAAAGFVGRGFAGAEVSASPMILPALSPPCLAHMARSLIQYGEALYLIRTDGGRLRLAPAQSWDVLGDPDPTTWRYRVTLGGASTIETYADVGADGVVHIQYSFDAREPWRGQGPLTVARLAGRLSAQLAAALGDEASGPRGGFLPVPLPGDDPAVAKLKPQIRKANGELLLVEAGDLEAANQTYAAWKTMRFGADTPAAVVELHKRASAEVWAACGIPPALFDADSDGTARREAYRQTASSLLLPLARLVGYELSMKLDDDVSLQFGELAAADIASKARAFQALVNGGMALDAAAAASGILAPDG